jgi:hypothetical protein
MRVTFPQALFGMQDDKTRWSLTIPLTPEQLAWWQERMRHTIAHLRETFPRARLVFRKLHRTDDAGHAVYHKSYVRMALCFLFVLGADLLTLSRSVRDGMHFLFPVKMGES